jgi:hypothetical protein
MQDMMVCLSILGIVFVPICISALIRRGLERWRQAKTNPETLHRKPLLPSDAWCAPEKNHGPEWRN